MRSLLCLVPLGGAWSEYALAEEAGRQLDEIVVTAQKREESLQNLSLAVSAFTAQILDAKGITNATELARSTPSMVLLPQNSGNTAFAVQMRGVSQADSVITADSPVGLYIDGVLVSKISGTLIDFIEPERIEVLRGPQGTLYGRNSTGGAVNIISKKPAEEFGLKAQAGFGNYSSQKYKVSLDTGAAPLGAGDVSARFSLYSLTQDGFGEDLTTGDDLDSRDRQAGLVAVRWRLDESFTLDYAYDRSNVREAPPIAQLHTDGSGYLGSYVTSEREDKLALSYSLPSETPAPLGIGRSDTDVESFGHTLTADWQLGSMGGASNLAIKSITGYREVDDNEPTDFDGTPIRWADFDIYQTLETFQQEFQFTGSMADERVNFVSGIFYYTEEADAVLPGVFGFGTVRNTPSFGTDNEAFALYGQVDWTPQILDDRLTLTAGARYNQETKRLLDATTVVDQPVGAGNGLVLAYVDRVSEDYDNVSPTFTVAYDLSEDISTYLRWSKGYKSGGFNGRGSTNEQLRTPFDDEELSATELGLKSFLFDRRLQLNVAAYLSDYENLQVAKTQAASNGVGFATINENIGKIKISGIEIEALAAVTDALTVDLSYSYTHVDVDEFFVCVPDSPNTCVDQNVRNEKVVGLTPDDLLSVGAQYVLGQIGSGELSARVDVYYQSDMLGGGQTLRVHPDDADPGYVEDYTLIDARLLLGGIDLGDGTLDISIWGKNLADEDSIRWANNLTETGLKIGVARYLDPRTYGVDFIYQL